MTFEAGFADAAYSVFERGEYIGALPKNFMVLYHVTTIEEWERQRNQSVFVPPAFAHEGFIHASTEEKIKRTLGRFFSGTADLCIISFDATKAGDVRFEDLDGEGMSFPHVYNPIPREALLSSRHFASVEEAISGFNKPETVIHRILDAAAVPSFSSFEETLHPWVVKTLDCVPDVTITRVPHASLLVRRASKKGLPIVVLSAHLDKIDHFDGQNPKVLRSFEWKEEIEGLLDDATGLGIVLSLFLEMADVPVDLVLALSELEEGTGLRFHPERMRMGGSGLKHGQGARELGKKLLAARKKPAGFVTIDTTPFFRGKPGVAVYANHWELNEMTPSPEIVSATQSLVSRLLEKNPSLQVLNNTNDYLEYGRLLVKKNHPVPCVALEPAIYPYHQADERVFKADIERIYTLAREAVVALGAIS